MKKLGLCAVLLFTTQISHASETRLVPVLSGIVVVDPSTRNPHIEQIEIAQVPSVVSDGVCASASPDGSDTACTSVVKTEAVVQVSVSFDTDCSGTSDVSCDSQRSLNLPLTLFSNAELAQIHAASLNGFDLLGQKHQRNRLLAQQLLKAQLIRSQIQMPNRQCVKEQESESPDGFPTCLQYETSGTTTDDVLTLSVIRR